MLSWCIYFSSTPLPLKELLAIRRICRFLITHRITPLSINAMMLMHDSSYRMYITEEHNKLRVLDPIAIKASKANHDYLRYLAPKLNSNITLSRYKEAYAESCAITRTFFNELDKIPFSYLAFNDKLQIMAVRFKISINKCADVLYKVYKTSAIPLGNNSGNSSIIKLVNPYVINVNGNIVFKYTHLIACDPLTLPSNYAHMNSKNSSSEKYWYQFSPVFPLNLHSLNATLIQIYEQDSTHSPDSNDLIATMFYHPSLIALADNIDLQMVPGNMLLSSMGSICTRFTCDNCNDTQYIQSGNQCTCIAKSLNSTKQRTRSEHI